MDEILEITKPKNEVLTFKVSKEDKQMITEFCESKGWRLSAFLRVSVLKNIEKEEKNGKET